MTAFILILVVLKSAFHEPTPGIHSWFHELSGDWSLQISSSWFEVGNSLGYSNKYELFRQTKSEGSNHYRLETIADGIDRISYNSEWVLAKMDNEWKLSSHTTSETAAEVFPKGWFWLDLHTGQRYWSLHDDDFKATAPEEVQLLEATLTKPRKSNRNAYLFLSGLLFLLFFYSLYKIIAERVRMNLKDVVISRTLRND